MVTNTQFAARWIAVSVLAETAAATVALVGAAVSWNAVVAVILFEALLLGIGQRWILRSAHRGLERGWLVATIAGTLLGRCVQYAADASAFAAAASLWPLAAKAGLGFALGALVGALMAAPQAYALSRQLDRAWLWILVRAAAWAIALPSLLFAGAAIASVSGTGLLVVVLTVIAVFALVAAFVGLVEGVALERIVARMHIWRYGVLPYPGDSWERAR